MLQSELMNGASLEALALLLASSYALARRALGDGWLAHAAEAPALAATENGEGVARSGARRRAEALRPRSRSRCLSRNETPRIVRIRGQ